MKNNWLLFIVLPLWLMLVPGVAVAEETGPFRLVGVELSGIKNVDKAVVEKSLSARVPSRWRFWISRPVLTEEDLQDDLQKIKRIYESHGYFHVHVDYSLHRLKAIETVGPPARKADSDAYPQAQPTHTAKVVFSVDEGPAARIHAVTVNPRDPSATLPDLTSPLKGLLDEGQPFEIANYREAKARLQKQMGNSGYPLATVSSHAVVNVESNTARIKFDVEPGPLCTFGPLSISMRELPVRETVIRRAITFETGARYESRRVDQSQRNLYNLDVFKSAVIRPGPPAPGQNAVPMQVRLKPKKRQTVKFGIGYGSEDRLRLKAGWTYRNLLGWAGRLSFNAKYSSLYEGVAGEYTHPYFWDSRNTLILTGGVERNHLDAYDNLSLFDELYLTRQLPKAWQGIAGYHLEINRLEDLNVSDPEERARFLKDDDYFISSVSLALARTRTNDETNPTSGHALSVGVALASIAIGSEVSYVSPEFELKLYQPLPLQMVLASRIRLQSIKELENTDYIPIFKRRFLGGSNTVRGYGYQQLGPLDDTGAPLGGLSSLNANIELRRRIYGSFSGALFLDMGLVSETAMDFPLDTLRYGAGAGLRYDTLIGPVRIDVGYKLNPQYSGEDRWRLHFSIGHAF